MKKLPIDQEQNVAAIVNGYINAMQTYSMIRISDMVKHVAVKMLEYHNTKVNQNLVKDFVRIIYKNRHENFNDIDRMADSYSWEHVFTIIKK